MNVIDASVGDISWRALFDAMPQLGWTARPDGYIDHYNRGWFEFTGTTPQQMEGWGWRSVHHPDHLDSVERSWRAALAGGVAAEFEFPLRRHDGVFRWFLTRVNPLRDDNGVVVRWVGINTDIDEQKQAELALRELHARAEAARAALDAQRARYQELFAQAPVAIALFSGPRLIIELANPSMCAQWGRPAEALLGKAMVEAMPELATQGFGAILDEVGRTGVPFVGNELPGRLARGPGGALEEGWFDFVFHPLRSGGEGEVVGVVGVAHEVTTQVLARREIAQTARIARFGAEVGAALTTSAPLATKLEACCQAMLVLGGKCARVWTLHEHEPVLELQARAGSMHVDGGQARVPVGQLGIGRIASTREPHITNAFTNDAGVADAAWAADEGIVAFAGFPLMVGDKLVGVMAVFGSEPLPDDVLGALRSMTTPIALAIESDRGERFRELFIGMLGHDLRNPLSAIMTGVQALALHPDATEKTKRSVARVLNSAGRMARMVTHLLDYTRARAGGGVPVVPLPGDVFAIASDVTEELRDVHPRHNVELVCHGDGSGNFDLDRMAQVFSNLIGNAMSHGDPTRPVRVTLDGRGPRIECEVLSFGAPINPEVLPFIFELFRRAQPSATSGGLGLGLFITREIVLAHHGAITASSTDKGTSFRFSVPREPTEQGPR